MRKSSLLVETGTETIIGMNRNYDLEKMNIFTTILFFVILLFSLIIHSISNLIWFPCLFLTYSHFCANRRLFYCSTC